MLKFVLTAVFLVILICLLYHPIPLPEDDSMFDKYRPSFEIKPTPDDTPDHFPKNNFKIAPDFQRDSVFIKGSQTLVDLTP